jgi:GTP-binding protein LepA
MRSLFSFKIMKRTMLHIRNFSIIAHIDHGKSTLADRPIQHTELVDQRQFHDQIRDTMNIKRERGIATKSQSVSLPYTCRQRETFELDLIDTAGDVDSSAYYCFL